MIYVFIFNITCTSDKKKQSVKYKIRKRLKTCMVGIYIYIYIPTIHVFNLFLILYFTDCFFLSDVHVILKINTYIMCSACHYVVVNLVKSFNKMFLLYVVFTLVHM